MSETPNSEWPEFWRQIVLNEDGSPNIEQIKKELADYKRLMDNASKVYWHVTDGRVSKPNAVASAVIREFESHVERLVDWIENDGTLGPHLWMIDADEGDR